MPKVVKGKDTSIRILKNGEMVQVFEARSFTVNQDADITRHKHLGKIEDELDTNMNGWSGTVEIEKVGVAIDDFMDAVIENNLARIGADTITIAERIDYRDGASRTYVYGPCEVTVGENVAGKDEAVVQTLNWAAPRRQKVE